MHRRLHHEHHCHDCRMPRVYRSHHRRLPGRDIQLPHMRSLLRSKKHSSYLNKDPEMTRLHRSRGPLNERTNERMNEYLRLLISWNDDHTDAVRTLFTIRAVNCNRIRRLQFVDSLSNSESITDSNGPAGVRLPPTHFGALISEGGAEMIHCGLTPAPSSPKEGPK